MDEKIALKKDFMEFMNKFNLLDKEFVVDIHGDNLFGFGSAAGEVFTGPGDMGAMIDYQRKLGVLYEKTDIKIHNFEMRENVAWIAATTDVVMHIQGEKFENQYRRTQVYEKIDDRWLIVQNHNSSGEKGVNRGDRLPTKAGIQSQINSWINTFQLLGIEDPCKKQLIEYLLKARELVKSLEMD